MGVHNYQLLFEQMMNGFALHEIILNESGAPCDYRFLDVNPAFEALTGLKRAQIIGRTVREVLPDIEPQWIETYGHVALTGQPAHFESYSAALDKYFEVQAYSPQPGQFVTIFADITERKQARLALDEHLRLFHALLDALPGIVVFKDRDLRFRLYNGTTAELFGRPLDELIGKTDADLWPPELAESFRAEEQQVMATGNPLKTEHHLQTPGGERWVDVLKTPLRDERGQVNGILCCEWDITDRKRLEQALAEERNLLRTLIDAIPDHVYVKGREGRVLLVNQAQARDLGYTDPAELVGKTNFDLLPASEAEFTWANDRVVLESGAPLSVEEEYTNADGETRRTWSVKVPLRDAAGQVIGVVGLSRDITERRRLEEQLRQAQKMEAIGALAGGIAHNFNNLLTAVIGFAEFALSELPPGSLAAQDIQQVLASSRQMAELTRWLLAFARRQMLRPVKVNLNELLARFEKVLAPALGQGIGLNLRLSPDLWLVKVDPAQIEQVLLNLAFNAQQAMPDGGQFTIETGNVALPPLPSVKEGLEISGEGGFLPPGDYVRLTVSDTGRGIDAKTLPRLFEPFFSTKGLAEATGLGLAAAYGIIKQHGGDIRVTSAPGCGARFEIYLPRARTE